MSITVILALLVLQDGPGRTPEELEQVRTKTGFTLDEGETEFEIVGTYLRIGEEDVEEFEAVIEVEYGVTDRFMLEIEVPYVAINPDRGYGEHGWGDIELEAKYRIPWEPKEISLAIGAEVSLLTGDEDKGLGGENTELGVFAGASRHFESFTLHLETGVEVEEEKKPEYELNSAVDWTPWSDDISLLLAVNGEIEPGEKPEWSLVPGFEIRFEWEEEEEGGEEEEVELQFGIGFPIGLSEEAQDWGVIIDIELEF